MGITFSPDYYYFDSAGNVTESGRVAEEPYFLAATQAGTDSGFTKGFQRLALASADVNAVNDMMNKGVSAEGLFMSPSFLFADTPTNAGMAKAQRFISQQTAALQTKSRVDTAAEKPVPPKWQFWKRDGA